jgi:protoheme IX farnesyltransferase
MGTSKAFRRLSVATTALTLLLIAWGGITRATGSGDGCPDWPKCFGRWIPRLEYHTLIEYTHRALAFLSGSISLVLAIVAIAGLVLERRGRPLPFPRQAAWLAVSLAPLYAAQGAVGGWIIASGLDPRVVTIHFAVAFLVLAIAVVITAQCYSGEQVLASEGRAALSTDGDAAFSPRSYARLAMWAAATTYALLLVGTYVRAEGSGLAFRDWPLMGGRLAPSLSGSGALEMFLHRGLALVVTAQIVWLAVRARSIAPRSRALVALSSLATASVIAQVILGGLSVVTDLAAAPRAAHVANSALLWAAVVASAVVGRREPAVGTIGGPATETSTETSSSQAGSRRLAAYFELTKPRIIVLLLVTTVPAMILARGGMPPLWLIAATLLGGAMAAGAANAMNMYLDRDIDLVMGRTRARPIPGGQVRPEQALRFGFVLGTLACAFLALVVNVLAAVLALAAIVFYIFVYTIWLKRVTPQNIVIGGAAGAVPVLVGWAAVTGTLAWPAWILFATVFAWTPPHFWALAVRARDDYAAARIPMLPVVRGDAETNRQIFVYSLVLLAITLVLVPVAAMGPVYLATAVLMGTAFCYRTFRLWRDPSRDRAWRLFKFSVLYLGSLFAAVAVDVLL